MTNGQILLMALNEPDYDRVSYFQIMQKESGRSALVFYKIMLDVCKEYIDKINTIRHRHIFVSGEDVIQIPMLPRLPLLPVINQAGEFGEEEILGLLENIKEAFTESEVNETSKLNYRGVVLLYHFWSKCDPAKAITETNAEKISKEYSLKKRELIKKWDLLVDDDNGQLKIIHNHIAKIESLKQYELILPKLKNVCPSGYNEAEKHREKLKKKK